MTVSNGRSTFLLVGRQDAPGVAFADAHECSGLVQRHVLRQQTVQNLKSCLFFLSQSHILQAVNLTLYLWQYGTIP